MKKISAEQADHAIAFVLRYGSLVSTVLMAMGLVVVVFGLTSAPYHSERGFSLGQLLVRLAHFDPAALLEFGVLLLLFTPILRIVVAIVTFAMERDPKFVLISLGVLTVVLVSISFAIRR